MNRRALLAAVCALPFVPKRSAARATGLRVIGRDQHGERVAEGLPAAEDLPAATVPAGRVIVTMPNGEQWVIVASGKWSRNSRTHQWTA